MHAQHIEDPRRCYMQVGGYEEGMREGAGLYIFPNGDRYEGDVAADLPQGAGVYHFTASDARLEGAWAEGRCHGWGLLTIGERQIYGAQQPAVPRCQALHGHMLLLQGHYLRTSEVMLQGRHCMLDGASLASLWKEHAQLQVKRYICHCAGRWEAGEAMFLAELAELDQAAAKAGDGGKRRGNRADDETSSDDELDSAEAEARDLAAESARTARAAAARAAAEANGHCGTSNDTQASAAAT